MYESVGLWGHENNPACAKSVRISEEEEEVLSLLTLSWHSFDDCGDDSSSNDKEIKSVGR